MDGAELIRQLRADPSLCDVPILAVTGHDPRDVPSLGGIKVAGLLLKPVAPETLLARVEAALEQSSALRARSAKVMAKVEPLLAKSAGLMAQAPTTRPGRRRQMSALRASSFYVLGFSGSTVLVLVLRSTLYVWLKQNDLNLQPCNQTL